MTLIRLILGLAFACLCAPVSAVNAMWPAKTSYRHIEVLGQEIFYREAGESNEETILLLHGYPSSSHTYRELIPLLSGRYHVIAPDNLGSGYSDKPDPANFHYDFDVLAKYIDGLLNALKIEKLTIYMQDFGAPVGYRVMMENPSRINAIIAQNANAYIEGIPAPKQNFFRKAQTDKSPENVLKLYSFTGPKAIKDKQYLRDVHGKEEIMSPDAWVHDSKFLESESDREIQVALFQDYKTNLDSYLSWQKFIRVNQFPTLIVWGQHDPVFTEEGAQAYLQDLPYAELHLLDAGHFAVEEKAVEIAQLITEFLGDSEQTGTITEQRVLINDYTTSKKKP